METSKPNPSLSELDTIDQRIIELYKSGKKIRAVQFCKDAKGLDLRVAKDYVDKLVIQKGIKTKSSPSISGFLGKGLIVFFVFGFLFWTLPAILKDKKEDIEKVKQEVKPEVKVNVNLPDVNHYKYVSEELNNGVDLPQVKTKSSFIFSNDKKVLVFDYDGKKTTFEQQLPFSEWGGGYKTTYITHTDKGYKSVSVYFDGELAIGFGNSTLYFSNEKE